VLQALLGAFPASGGFGCLLARLPARSAACSVGCLLGRLRRRPPDSPQRPLAQLRLPRAEGTPAGCGGSVLSRR